MDKYQSKIGFSTACCWLLILIDCEKAPLRGQQS